MLLSGKYNEKNMDIECMGGKNLTGTQHLHPKSGCGEESGNHAQRTPKRVKYCKVNNFVLWSKQQDPLYDI